MPQILFIYSLLHCLLIFAGVDVQIPIKNYATSPIVLAPHSILMYAQFDGLSILPLRLSFHTIALLAPRLNSHPAPHNPLTCRPFLPYQSLSFFSLMELDSLCFKICQLCPATCMSHTLYMHSRSINPIIITRFLPTD